MSSSAMLTSPLRAVGRHRRLVACIAPLAVIALGAAVILPTAPSGAAQAPVNLGSATSFAVLAGSGITNTGPTTITGDIGTSPTPAETGTSSITQPSGANHDADAVAANAQNALTTGYNAAAGAPSTSVPDELGAGKTFTPGVYNGGALQITGTMTLDTQGDPNAVFIFKAASTLTTAGASNIVVIGSTSACNVFWQVTSSATLGTSSHFVGSLLALTSITATTSATIEGRLLARNGAVTLDSNTITAPVCAAAATTTTAAGATTTPTSGATPTTARAGATSTTRATGAAPVPTTTTSPAPGTPAAPGTPGAPGTPAPGTPGAPGTPATPATPGTSPPLPHTL